MGRSRTTRVSELCVNVNAILFRSFRNNTNIITFLSLFLVGLVTSWNHLPSITLRLSIDGQNLVMFNNNLTVSSRVESTNGLMDLHLLVQFLFHSAFRVLFKKVWWGGGRTSEATVSLLPLRVHVVRRLLWVELSWERETLLPGRSEHARSKTKTTRRNKKWIWTTTTSLDDDCGA